MVNIIVVFPKLEDAKNIRNLLARNGYSVIGVCCTGAQVLQIIDNLEDGIVICGYRFNDMMYADLRESLASSFQMLLVASMHILESCDHRDIVSLPLPLRIGDLANTLEMMAAGMYRRRRRQKSQPKERSEAEKKVILDAKKLLMERNHMSEEEAHRYMQKCSMDSGNNMVETAKIIFALMKY